MQYYLKEIPFASLRDITQINSESEWSLVQIPHIRTHSEKLNRIGETLNLGHYNT